MKKLLFVACILFTAQSFAQDKAKICFIRNTGAFLALADFKEFIDGKIVCMIDNKSYTVHEVDAGEHSITWQSGKKELAKEGKDMMVTMNLEAGKTYYFQILITKGFMSAAVSMNELTESTAKKIMAELKEDTNCFK